MSGKLDQSLDEIVSTQRKAGGRRGRNPARRASGRPATTAPVGGVQKNSKKPQAATKQAPAKAAGGPGDSKVVVSNLPKDVTESQIKEYFLTSVGPIKRLELAYGPGGASRGVATITFSKRDGASKAFNQLNGLLVDGRPIKIEIILSGDKAAEMAPAPKTLTERISQPKSQPKSAAPNKKKEAAAKDAAAGGAARGGRRRTPRGKSSRPAKKSAEELDSEMADYFVSGNQNENATEGTAAPATNGDAPMEDDIM
ncbi:RNA recognition domain-containing protein [Seiridium cupressi]|uniref:RRM domain-containing protein n=1 Tax=Seiridium unicorne TaxID=138068 RepID=A0ABR2VCJ1_9PEZI